MAELRFNGRVVVITGAGAGLGRAYALLFASRGAFVVVNDLGTGPHGEGGSSKAADSVVQEIRSLGGTAVADYNSVVDGEKIIKTALDNFGRVDVVINNAGVLRDKSFARISNTDWDIIHDVHLKGAFKVTQAAWPHFRKQNYGRVIVTSSNSGLCGNFGQANYSAAKMGLVGLSNTLAVEGKKNNINCNVLVPTAASRLTEDIFPPELFAELKPELIAPVVLWLCHESCEETGSIIESGAGWATKVILMRGNGSLLRKSIIDCVSPETVRDKWNIVTDMSSLNYTQSIQESSFKVMEQLDRLRSGGQGGQSSVEAVSSNPDVFKYKNKDAVLYALGIGATTSVESDLQYLYENGENFSVFPTFAIIPGLLSLLSSENVTTVIPGKTFDLSQVLHGEQYLKLYKPLPTEGVLKSYIKTVDVIDKGKGAVIISEAETLNESGEKVAFAQITTFVIGAGGFGGKKSSDKQIPVLNAPNRKPDASYSEQTTVDQAALYRLSGDPNPLHIDPNFALAAGYKKPILHGLCTLGFAVRHVLYKFANNDPSAFQALKVRFVKPVIPGQTLKTDMWQEGNRIHFQTSVPDTDTVVLSGAYVDLSNVKYDTSSNTINSNMVAAEDLQSDIVFAGMQERVDSNPALLKQINGVFAYNITKGGQTVATWIADLKTGKIYKGAPKNGIKVDTTLTIDDGDMLEMAIGKLNPQVAFMKGKLKIKGNIMLTQKLKALMTEPKL